MQSRHKGKQSKQTRNCRLLLRLHRRLCFELKFCFQWRVLYQRSTVQTRSIKHPLTGTHIQPKSSVSNTQSQALISNQRVLYQTPSHRHSYPTKEFSIRGALFNHVQQTPSHRHSYPTNGLYTSTVIRRLMSIVCAQAVFVDKVGLIYQTIK